MGLPAGARGILTSGGSLSNFSAIVTARDERLDEDFQDGSIYFSEETHHCVTKAARLAGFPRASLRELPTDARFRLVPAALEQAIREDRSRGRRPFLVVANVGHHEHRGRRSRCPRCSASPASTASGSTPTPPTAASSGWPREARRSCEGSRSATRSPSTRTRASSCRTASGRSSCATARRSPAPTADTASYVQDVADEGSLGFADLSPELSRDFRGLRVWLPLMLHGVAAFREQLAEKLALARWAYDELSRRPAASRCSTSRSCRSWPSACARPSRRPSSLGPELLRRVNARRRVFLSSTRIGRPLRPPHLRPELPHPRRPRARRGPRPQGRGGGPPRLRRLRRPRAPPSPAAARGAAGASGRPASRAGG